MIYFDNGATTFPKPKIVYDEMDAYSRTKAVNAGRGAYFASRESSAMIKETREMLISLVDAKEQAEVVITPSVTIALNEVICGFKWNETTNAYVSPYEHNSVLRPLKLMKEKYGFNIFELPLKNDLSIDLEQTEKLFESNPPGFVAMSAISNVTGYILPAEKVFKMAKKNKAFTLLDGAQAVGLLKMRFSQLYADVLTFAGHKTLYGPFGTGGFFIRNGADKYIDTVLSGGTGSASTSLEMPKKAPGKYECGSKDTVSICGLHAALKWLRTVNTFQVEDDLVRELYKKLSENPKLILYTAPDLNQQGGVISFNVNGFSCSEAAAILDTKYDIAVRAGHHCAALIHKYLKDEEFKGTVRVSVGYFNTKEEINYFAEALKSIDREMLKDIDKDILRGVC